MSNLLNDSEGRSVVLTAQKWLLERRLSRFFKRNLVIDYDQFKNGGAEFDLSTLLGSLNSTHDDELRDLYRLLGTIGGLAESIADTSIYIDGVAGSDINGTGSAARPYATPWFMSLLPRRINHKYRVLIISDTVLDSELLITNEISESGCLSFIGVGVPTEVHNAAAGVLTATATEQLSSVEMVTSIAPIAACRKSFIQLTDGAAIGRTTPVILADIPLSTVVGRVLTVSAAAPGDSYRYIVPPVTLSVQRLMVKCAGSNSVEKSLDTRGARVNFANMIIDIPDSTFGTQDFVEIDTQFTVGLWFCQLLVPFGNSFTVVLKSDINNENPVDTQLETLSQTTVTNIIHGITGLTPKSAGCQIEKNAPGTFMDAASRVVYLTGNKTIWSLDCKGQWEANGFTGQLYGVSAGSIKVTNSNCRIATVIVDPDSHVNNGFELINSALEIDYFIVGKCNANCFWLQHSRLYFDHGGGSVATAFTSLPGSSLELHALSSVYFNHAWTGTNAVSDITMIGAAVPFVTAFPAVSTQVTDGIGQIGSRGTL